jgi:hypothetical protein
MVCIHFYSHLPTRSEMSFKESVAQWHSSRGRERGRRCGLNITLGWWRLLSSVTTIGGPSFRRTLEWRTVGSGTMGGLVVLHLQAARRCLALLVSVTDLPDERAISYQVTVTFSLLFATRVFTNRRACVRIPATLLFSHAIGAAASRQSSTTIGLPTAPPVTATA